MDLRTSSSLIADANAFLDSLAKPVTLTDVEKSVKALSKLRDDMLHSGFGATFQSAIIMPGDESEIEDKADIGRQLRIFREFANMKRYALNRVRVALAAHGILYNMLKRGAVYPVADALPYNGAYLLELIGQGEPAIRAYSILQDLAATPTGTQTEGFAVLIKAGAKKIRLNLASVNNLEDKVKQSYGDEAVIASIKKHNVSPPLIRKKSMRIAVSVGYALLAAKTATKDMHASKPTSSDDTEQYRLYASLLSKKGFSPDARVDLFEGHDALKDILYSKGLLEGSDDAPSLNPDVMNAIKKRRAVHCSAIVNEAHRLFSFDVFRFFLTEPRRSRSSYPLFHGVSEEFGSQYSFLSLLSKTLGKDPTLILKDKIHLETLTNMQSKLLGVACLHLSGKPLDWCAETFEVESADIEKAADEIRPLLKGKQGGKSKEFLDLVKKS
jgi:hypothetical protein